MREAEILEKKRAGNVAVYQVHRLSARHPNVGQNVKRCHCTEFGELRLEAPTQTGRDDRDDGGIYDSALGLC